ncbi:MAG: DciA family protein [Planctomycetota bacterium]|jgi:predicted nucleic acid-binding Zn ribbon protein
MRDKIMDEIERVRSAERIGGERRTRSDANRVAMLGDAVKQLMEDRVSPQQTRFESICDLWSELLPAELSRHCRLGDISGGRLNVFVDSPPYMHELRLCSPELLEEIQRRCPQARIRRIQFAIR